MGIRELVGAEAAFDKNLEPGEIISWTIWEKRPDRLLWVGTCQTSLSKLIDDWQNHRYGYINTGEDTRFDFRLPALIVNDSLDKGYPWIYTPNKRFDKE